MKFVSSLLRMQLAILFLIAAISHSYGQSILQNPAGTSWKLKGNAGTKSNTNFLGTTDNVSLRVRTNDQERMVIDSIGNVGIGTTTPSARLHVNGVIRLVDGTQGLNKVLMSAANGDASWKHADSVLANSSINWHLTGNNVANSSISFIGTIDSVSLRLRTFNQHRMVLDSVGNVGIATGAPNVQLDVTGDIAYREATGITISGTANNLSVADYSFFRISHTSSASVSGFATGFDGKVLTIFNNSVSSLSLLNESASSIAANRIITGAETLTLEDSGSVTLHYSASLSRWIVTSYINGILSGSDYETWNLKGNSSTDAENNFVGTADSVDFVFKTESIERMRVRADGRVRIGVGSSSPFPQLEVYANTTLDTVLLRVRNNASSGTIVQVGSVELFHDFLNTIDLNNGSNTARFSINLNNNAAHDLQMAYDDAGKPGTNTWTTTSDERLKDEIHPFKDGLEILGQIKPVYFRYNGKGGIPGRDFYVGVIAQQLQKAAPYMVGSTEYTPDPRDLVNREEYLTVNNGAMTYLLVNATQELSAKTERLAAAIKTTSDFGLGEITSGKEAQILFSEEFSASLLPGQVPVVTAAALNHSTPVAVKNISASGFTVCAGVPVTSLSVSWMAVAQMNTENIEVHKNYSIEERQQMLDKVKMRKATIRMEGEEAVSGRRLKGG